LQQERSAGRTIQVDQALQQEWFLANGLGGFAAQTAMGFNARRYHGLLIAALNPPTDRRLLLAKVDEEVEAPEGTYELATNRFAGAIHPLGYQYLDQFSLSPLHTFVYRFSHRVVDKTIYMVHGRNAVGIRYRYVAGGEPLRLRLLPLVNCRDYHHTLRANDWPFHQEIGSGSVTIEAYPGAPRLRLTVNNAHATKYQATGVWYHSFDYPLEAERGLDHLEDHYQPGVFEVWLSPGEEITLMGEVAGDDGAAPVDIPSPETELARLAGVEHQAGFRHPTLRSLVRAADAFIVDRRSTGAKTIIAGYPWFTDWGRDTMIALPGLTMVTGRLEDARSILETFARYERGGLFPNNFPDVGEEPAYHTVDASLWFVNAVYSYHCYSSDRDFVASRLYPVVESVIRHYRDGTGFNIHMEDDGLIWAGAPGTALTWMDAKVGLGRHAEGG
jgi:predicted glycogen debranching enzyme